MPDDKPAHDRALELLVYAPVGVALYVRDMLPTMMTVFVSRGKREVQSHLPGQAPPPPPAPVPPIPTDVRRRVEESLGLARVVTESGIGVAKGVAGTGFGFARGLADTAVQGLGAMQPNRGGGATIGDRVAPSASTAPATSEAPAAPASTAPSTPEPTPAPSAATPAPAAPTPAPATAAEAPAPTPSEDGGPTVESLAIPDYDELSASQVVERLEGLDESSLESIRRYEAAHRGRNTILGKISRLT